MEHVTAARRVRQARVRSGVTQGELARRSGVPQPHISAIENGRVEPTEQMVVRLLSAVRVRPSVVLQRCKNEVLELVSRRRGKNVRVFGSIARGEDHVGSDIDLLVDFDGKVSIFEVAGMAAELEELLGVHVDVITDGTRSSVLPRKAEVLRKITSEAVPL